MKSIFGKMKGPFRIMFQWPIYAAVFMAIINAGVFFINVKAGFFVLATLVIYGVAVVVFYLTKNSEITNSMVEFASGYAQMQKKLLKGFSVPYGLVDEEGKIIWTNNALEKLIGKENVNRNVVVVFGNVVAPEKMVYGTTTEYNTRFADKDYKVVLEPVNLEDIDTETSMIVAGTDSGIYALYLFDETEINACKKELRDERFVTALIYIDNYDEALESIDEVPQLVKDALDGKDTFLVINSQTNLSQIDDLIDAISGRLEDYQWVYISNRIRWGSNHYYIIEIYDERDLDDSWNDEWGDEWEEEEDDIEEDSADMDSILDGIF